MYWYQITATQNLNDRLAFLHTITSLYIYYTSQVILHDVFIFNRVQVNLDH